MRRLSAFHISVSYNSYPITNNMRRLHTTDGQNLDGSRRRWNAAWNYAGIFQLRICTKTRLHLLNARCRMHTSI